MLLNILLYIILSELGGLAFLAATKDKLGGFAQILVWGFVVSPIIAVALLGSPLGLVVWAAHRAFGFYIYRRFYRR